MRQATNERKDDMVGLHGALLLEAPFSDTGSRGA